MMAESVEALVERGRVLREQLDAEVWRARVLRRRVRQSLRVLQQRRHAFAATAAQPAKAAKSLTSDAAASSISARPFSGVACAGSDPMRPSG
ncbi:MAG: hypothetical protein JWM77_422 [Rhodospirillales bacterium]|nr:hypothetical protein [Rhodospirillales bacterium]